MAELARRWLRSDRCGPVSACSAVTWDRSRWGAGRLWEVSILFHLRAAFRFGDIRRAHSQRFGDLKEALVPVEVAHAAPRLNMPLESEAWLFVQGCRSSIKTGG